MYILIVILNILVAIAELSTLSSISSAFLFFLGMVAKIVLRSLFMCLVLHYLEKIYLHLDFQSEYVEKLQNEKRKKRTEELKKEKEAKK